MTENEIRTRPVALSRRLLAITQLAGEGICVCDVGCDHAHVPIRLLQNGQFKRAIAMDVIKGPLEKAAGNLSLYGMEDRVELRLSDGLDAFRAGEADTLVVTGMGGRIMQEILLREPEKTRSFSALVLGPQSEPEKVRSALRMLCCRIMDERLIYDDGKYYPVIRADKRPDCPVGGARQQGPVRPAEEKETAVGIPADGGAVLQDVEDMFGPVLLSRRDGMLYEFLVRRRAVQEKILRSVEAALGKMDDSKDVAAEDPLRRRHLEKAEEIRRSLVLYREAISLFDK